MCVGSIISAGASLLGGKMASDAAKDASRATLQAGREQMQHANAAAAEYSANSPLAVLGGVGGPAYDSYWNLMGFNGEEAMNNAVTQLPGYEFRLNEGLKAVEQSAVASRSLRSGKTLKALTEYGQNFATAERNTELSRLEGLVFGADTSAANVANIKIGAAANNAQLQTIAAGQRFDGTANMVSAIGDAAGALGEGIGSMMKKTPAPTKVSPPQVTPTAGPI